MHLSKIVTFVVLAVTYSTIRGQVAEATKSLYAGSAHFLPAGDVVSPVAYKSLGIEIKIPKYEDHVEDVKKEVQKYMDTAKREMETKFGKEEAELVTNRIARRMIPQIQRLETAVESLLSFYKATSVEQRSPTLIFGAVSAVIGSIMAVGSSLLAHGEISRVATEVHRIRGHEKKMTADIKQLGKGMKTMQRQTFEYHLEEEIVSNLTMMIEPTILETQQVLDGLYLLRQHLLHPGLVPPEVLLEIQEELDREKDKEWHSVFDLQTELMNMPVSYLQGNRALLILIHVPTVSEGRSMIRKLYRLDSAVVESEQQLVKLTSTRPYISVDKAWSTHQTMSNDDLASCVKIGKVHLCQDDNILLKRPTCCTAALFFGMTELAVEMCEARVMEEDVPAVQVNNTLYAVKPATVTTRCPGQEPKVMTLKRVTKFKVDPECTVEGELFTIAPRSRHVQPKVIKHRVLLPEVIVPSPPPSVSDVVEPDLDLKLFVNNYNPDGEEELDDYEDEVERKDLDWNQWWSAFLVGFCCFLLLLIIIAISWACWRLGHKRGLKRSQAGQADIEGAAGLHIPKEKEPNSRQRDTSKKDQRVREETASVDDDTSGGDDADDISGGAGVGGIFRRPPESVADGTATRRKKMKKKQKRESEVEEE